MHHKILVSLACLGLAACSSLPDQKTPHSDLTNLETKTPNQERAIATPIPETAKVSNADHSDSSSVTATASITGNENEAESGAISDTLPPNIPDLQAETWTHELLQTRKYHGDEVTAVSGEVWWGLFVMDNGFELLPTTVTVNTVRDVVLDPEDGEFTGKEIVTDNTAASVFLVKGPIALEAGAVKTVFFGSAPLPGRGQEDLSLSLAMPTGVDQPSYHSPSLENFSHNDTLHTVLTFFESRERQTQPYNLGPCCDMARPTLIWAGDLDRDGKLDFLIDTTRYYSVSELTLFVSSAAQAGEIVRPIARIRSVSS